MDNYTASAIIATLILLPFYAFTSWATCWLIGKIGETDRWWFGFFWGNLFWGTLLSDIRMITHHCGG